MATPSWLKEQENTAPPMAAEAVPNESLTSIPMDNATPSMTPISGDDEKDLPSVVLFMRLANMAVASALIASSIAVVVSLPPLSVWILSIYATCCGFLVCCLETQLKFLRTAISLNFGFLFSPFWRFLFYCLMASVAWTFRHSSSIATILGPVVAASLIAVAFFNTYVLWRYPSYRATREKIAEEEDRRIEAKISGEVKKQAMKSWQN